MTLIRFVQRASILAGITLSGIVFHGGSATAQAENFCVVASNGKTACGTLKAVERACVSTDNGVVCGKFKSVAAEQGQEAAKSAQVEDYRQDSDGVTYLLRNCKKTDSTVKCNFTLTTKKGSSNQGISAGKGRSAIVDSAGKTYASSNVEYSGKISTSFFNPLSPNVEYVVDLNFEDIPRQVTKAALLSVRTNGKVIQFRNVPFLN